MALQEMEHYSDINGDERASLEDYFREEVAKGMEGFLEDDRVARLDYVHFVSRSKGRNQYGERRKRKYQVEVELVGRGKRYKVLREDGSGGLDEWAEEVLGESVPANEALAEFIRRLRALPEQQRIARGRK